MELAAMWEYFICWTEHHPGLASWVQAVGAVLSIWFAWWIASRQSRRAEASGKRKDEAKCLALAEMITYSMSVFETHRGMSNDMADVQRFRDDLSMAKAILDSVDLFSLPDPDLIFQACSARRLIDKTVIQFNDPFALGYPAIVFEAMTAIPAIESLAGNIRSCKEISKRFK